ncbi:hypothetical protein AB0B83_08575 [Micromonospora sp. NPDC049060]|uniref:hypothetical protein n=1 Tax=Micromonospora sp. NPDC049060 TaxID=3154828 RepID=UPI0033D70246
MNTAQKITAGIALLAALGVGALLQAWVTHLLHRRERKVNIADKSVQMAATLMNRMEAELGRAQEALDKAEREAQELRAELAEVGSISEQRAALAGMDRTFRESAVHLRGAAAALAKLQGEVREVQNSGRIVSQISMFPSSPPPVDEDVWAEMVDQHEEDEYRRGVGRGGG